MHKNEKKTGVVTFYSRLNWQKIVGGHDQDMWIVVEECLLSDIGKRIKSTTDMRLWFLVFVIIYFAQWFLVTWKVECSCHDFVKPIQVLLEILYYGKGEALLGFFIATLFEFGILAVVIGWIIQFLAGLIVKRKKEKPPGL